MGKNMYTLQSNICNKNMHKVSNLVIKKIMKKKKTNEQNVKIVK